MKINVLIKEKWDSFKIFSFKDYYSKGYLRHYMVFLSLQIQSLYDAVKHCNLLSEDKLLQFCYSNCFQMKKKISSREVLEIIKYKEIATALQESGDTLLAEVLMRNNFPNLLFYKSEQTEKNLHLLTSAPKNAFIILPWQ